MTTLLSFVVVIGVLILFHELGHFLVARWCGVGVERFSIGFGPVLLRWRGKETEYCLSAIPMGGYVKMLGEENPLEGGGGTIAFDPKKSFALKPLWVRFLIVFAGPGMNFVLAAIIFTLALATLGRPVWPPLIGRVAEGGPARAAGVRTGDLVVAVDGRRIVHWEDLEGAVADSRGRALALTVRRDGAERSLDVTPRRTTVHDPIFRDPREAWELGAGPQLTPEINAVMAGMPAQKAGVRVGDLVRAVAGRPVYSPEEMTQTIQKRAGQTFELTVERAGRTLALSVTAQSVRERGPDGRETEIGRIGVGITTKVVSYEPYGPVQAVWYGLVTTWEVVGVVVKGFSKLVLGTIERSNLGGPIQIAAEAGKQAREGLAALARFTAVISINLAVLNLLPVPMLDGGHLFFFVIEAIMGRPLSLKKREAAQQVGFVLLLLLMVYALYNDFMRIGAFKLLKWGAP